MIVENGADNIQLVALAHDIKDKFTIMFSLFPSCHHMYNSRDEVDVTLLGKYLII